MFLVRENKKKEEIFSTTGAVPGPAVTSRTQKNMQFLLFHSSDDFFLRVNVLGVHNKAFNKKSKATLSGMECILFYFEKVLRVL